MSDILSALENSECQAGQKVSGTEQTSHGTKLESGFFWKTKIKYPRMNQQIKVRRRGIKRVDELLFKNRETSSSCGI